MSPNYSSQNLDHLGLVAGMYDGLGIGEYFDSRIPQGTESRHVTVGQAVKALVLNGLGFVNRALYLTPQFFADKPTELLIGDGVEPAHLNDDVLGRALDTLYAHDVTAVFSGLGAQAAQRLGLPGSTVHLDSTSFHVDGAYAQEPEAGVIELVPGYSRDHRPELNQAMLNLVVEQRAGLPLLMAPLSGNSSDKVSFGELIDRHIDNLTTTHAVDYWVADSALYTPENLKTLSAHQGKWISRVPETIGLAQAQRDATEPAMSELAPGYRYRSVTVEYAGVTQRWLVILSLPAMKRAGPGVRRRLVRTGETERKAYAKLAQQRFACAADARRALTRWHAGLELLMLEDAEVVKDPRVLGTAPCWQIIGNLASDPLVRWGWLWQKATFILATNELDTARLADPAVWEHYRQQQQAERGFRFLKDPRFQANTLFLKSPKRIMALLMVMTVCLMVYAALEYRLRQAISDQQQPVPDQKGKPTSRPTMRWVFQFFAGIHRLRINGQPAVILNLKPPQVRVITLLGPRYQGIYGVTVGASG